MVGRESIDSVHWKSYNIKHRIKITLSLCEIRTAENTYLIIVVIDMRIYDMRILIFKQVNKLTVEIAHRTFLVCHVPDTEVGKQLNILFGILKHAEVTIEESCNTW